MIHTSFFKAGAILAAGLLLSSAATAQNNHTVMVGEFGFVFEPAEININVGDTITWVWGGAATHNVHSDHDAFQSALVSAPNTFSVTFDAAFIAANPVPSDNYTYVCDPHAAFGMVGAVQVMSARTLSTTNFSAGQSGTIDLDGANPGGTVIIAYSTNGTGPVDIAFGTLSLTPPFGQLPTLVADAAGSASFGATVPAGFAGVTLNLHAVELLPGGEGILSNPVSVLL